MWGFKFGIDFTGGSLLQVGFSGELFVPPLDEPAWERLGIPVSMLSTIIAQADAQLTETMSILSGVVSHE